MKVTERSYCDLTEISAEDVNNKIGTTFWKAEFGIKGDINDVNFNKEKGVFEVLNIYDVKLDD